MLVNDLLEKTTERFPDKNAVWFKGETRTYSEILDMSRKVSGYLSDHNIERGDRVAVLIENSHDHIIAYFGVLFAGCVSVSLNTQTTAEALIYLLNNSDAKAIITTGKYSKQLLPALKKCPKIKEIIIDQEDLSAYERIGHCNTVSLADLYKGEAAENDVRSIDIDLAEIVYTSGSTGNPKGVMLTHLNLVSNMKSIVSYAHLSEDDSILVVLPFYYIYGKSLLLTHFLVGGTVIIDNNFLYPNQVLATMKKQKATGFAGVPSTFMILLDRSSVRKYSFDSLRYLMQAGGAMAPSVQKEVKEVFSPAKLYIMYGATEAAPRLSYLEPDRLDDKLGSIGKAVDNVDLLLVDDNGNPVPPGEVGEIAARGSNIMRGYWKDPEGTGEVLRNGLYYTGDLAKIDDEGFFFVVGRSKDIIKVKGFRVSAKEIEEKILELDEVHETAVIGVEDDILGEAVKAFIVPRSEGDCDSDMIEKHLRKNLPQYKLPKFIEFRGKLPKNKSGKILKQKLKEEISGDE
ncbi:MAG TPA: AMP-binding protein [Candidatus Krumholzibacteriaceae bacterium]|nr:AMP-binding protein [Candidatus Krumholzibacteriaceae bacterium]